jgi:type I restriction enzyme, R subunit
LKPRLRRCRPRSPPSRPRTRRPADTLDYREAETRDLFIDLLLREAGFDPKAPNVIEVEVKGMPNAPGVGYVDYVLRGDDGKPLALVEAKRTRKDPRIGQQQAKLYADCLEAQYAPVHLKGCTAKMGPILSLKTTRPPE